MSSRIRVGIINYLNVLPFLYGLKKSPVMDMAELVETYPSELAQMLLDDRVDIGIVPVAILPEMKNYHIISDFCIGCDGPVASVCLFSQAPLEEIETVWLDYQSRTSVALAQILLEDYWKIKPVLRDAGGEEFRRRIKDNTAGLVIGDRALEQRAQSAYMYDLGAAWKDYTGSGFVFAAWVANKELPREFTVMFNDALASGLQQIDEVVRENPYPLFDLDSYYRNNVSYVFDDRKKAGMEMFLSRLNKMKTIAESA
ncbi:MAG: menaquinone biosynthesis protein [Chitinophagaceae bacterium]|nr:menaquinone biosynthesis protein [Chitinophagaceae bacterium]MCW5926086.1 menaquinone biosynthesis protein [Chitinophagaceae bacterium]